MSEPKFIDESIKLYIEPQTIKGEDVVSLVSELRSHGQYTLGVLLTAVEAALGDSKQAEALKAIVRREMFSLMDRNQGEVYERSKQQKHGLKPPEQKIDGQDDLR